MNNTLLTTVYTLLAALGPAQEPSENRVEKIGDRLTVSAPKEQLGADERFNSLFEAVIAKLRATAPNCAGTIQLTREEKQTARGTKYTVVHLRAEKRVTEEGRPVIRSTQTTLSPGLVDDEEAMKQAIGRIKSYLDCKEKEDD